MKPPKITPEQAFKIYLDLGQKRSATKTTAAIIADPKWGSIAQQTVRGWCSKYGWVERATEFDNLAMRQAADEMLIEHKGQRKTAAATARMMADRVIARADEILPTIQCANPTEFRQLTDVAVSLWQESDKLEHLMPVIEQQSASQTAKAGEPTELQVNQPAPKNRVDDALAKLEAMTCNPEGPAN